jgi:hypothetical protein
MLGMTAKELLAKRVPTVSEAQAQRALLALDAEPVSSREGESAEPDVVGLPESWGRMANGEPMPNVVAAVRRSREEH